ncbi:MAG: hypothetical protein KUG75_09145 [Pseudomonadales bacterium]|nr:hypothetical protein [Pseudomonadales bacterium]
MDQVEHTLTDRQKYWLEHVKACEASGKIIADYAREHDLDLKSMYAGKRNLVQKGVLPHTRTSTFQRMRTARAQSSDDWRIQLPNGVSVGFSGTVDVRALTQVLTAAATIG